MKQLYFLNEEEKNRILNLHESATKRHYLGEQQTAPNIISNNDNAYEYKSENGKYFFKGKQGTKFAKTYPDWRESKASKGISAIKSLFDKLPKPEEKNTSVVDPSKAATETAKVTQTGAAPSTPSTPASSTPATGTPTTPTTPTTPGATSGVVAVNANDIIATPETGTPVASTT